MRKSKIEPENIRLNVLVCDATNASGALRQALEQEKHSVQEVRVVPDPAAAQDVLAWSDLNAIFIDPLAQDLEVASAFVFSVRKSHPEIIFALYVDQAEAESRRTEFYRGERRRFSHYYTLDKRTPVAVFQDELRSVIHLCQADLSWRMSELNVRRLLDLQLQQGNSTKTADHAILLEAASAVFAQLSDLS